MYRKKLVDLGIHAELKGFEFLNYAMEIYKPGQGIIKLYESVAEHFGTTRQRVERNIRHAIGKSGEYITNGQFIAKYKIIWSDDNES